MSLVLWGRASSVNVQKVLWALAELDLPFEHRPAGGKFGGVDTTEFGALNPNRRVPVLEDGGFALWESHAILRHLARRETRLWPVDIEGQGLADQWMEFTNSTLQPPFIAAFWQLVRLPAAQQDAQALAAGRAVLGAALAVLEGRLAQSDWLAGPSFSMADIAAGSLMHRIVDLGLLPVDLLAVARWTARLQMRPAFRATIATSYEELRAP